MARDKKGKFVISSLASDIFGVEEDDVRIVDLVARLTDRTPEEVHEAAYEGPLEEFFNGQERLQW